jgi:hypothetical protein
MKRNQWLYGILLVVMILIMQGQGHVLKIASSPHGIIDLEFANTPAKLHAVLSGWDAATVRLNIWLDFLFIVTYVLVLSTSSIAAASLGANNSFWNRTGQFFSRAAFLTGMLDVAENLLMLNSIAGNFSTATLELTAVCATLKFILAGTNLIYLLLAILYKAFRK